MYEPETDSEDELPPGWEERATLTGKIQVFNLTAKRLMLNISSGLCFYQYNEDVFSI